mmetsp:Transcript_6927/g.21877  ORF Transcript_6927/g.21877 Transcript_6927/m.21877 type:complete len:184 (+) Transcript_6927:306-857(+)
MAALDDDAATAQPEWSFLEWRRFPPLYTLQPHPQTRKAQLKIWVDVVWHWAQENDAWTFRPDACGAFSNASIDRALDQKGAAAVVDAVVAAKRGELLEDGRLWVMAERPDDLADRVYEWAAATDRLGGVYTLEELSEDDGPLAGVADRLARAALARLEDDDKCEVFTGATSSEAGVKFFRRES